VVVRRRSIAERQKPAQKRDLLLAEPCNIDESRFTMACKAVSAYRGHAP
jgi:hypothetical protein